MKKVIVILLLMVYAISSTGMTVHFHYCCGKLKSVDLTPPKADHCFGKPAYQPKAKPCCADQKVELKVKDDQSVAKVLHAAFGQSALKPSYQQFFISSPEENKNLVIEVFSPPPVQSQPLFILNCVFRI